MAFLTSIVIKKHGSTIVEKLLQQSQNKSTRYQWYQKSLNCIYYNVHMAYWWCDEFMTTPRSVGGSLFVRACVCVCVCVCVCELPKPDAAYVFSWCGVFFPWCGVLSWCGVLRHIRKCPKGVFSWDRCSKKKKKICGVLDIRHIR